MMKTLPFNKFVHFTCVADFIQDGVHRGDIVTAIETDGFFTWDRYGRYIHVPASGGDDERKALRTKLLDQLAELWGDCDLEPGPEERDVYHFTRSDLGNLIYRCGWMSGEEPDFQKCAEQWNDREFASKTAPSEPGSPPKNSLKNYYRLIRILADMANLDISQPHKAAEVVMSHGASKDLPIPSNSKTFADRFRGTLRTE
jgi:hypothetical protein